MNDKLILICLFTTLLVFPSCVDFYAIYGRVLGTDAINYYNEAIIGNYHYLPVILPTRILSNFMPSLLAFEFTRALIICFMLPLSFAFFVKSLGFKTELPTFFYIFGTTYFFHFLFVAVLAQTVNIAFTLIMLGCIVREIRTGKNHTAQILLFWVLASVSHEIGLYFTTFVLLTYSIIYRKKTYLLISLLFFILSFTFYNHYVMVYINRTLSTHGYNVVIAAGVLEWFLIRFNNFPLLLASVIGMSTIPKKLRWFLLIIILSTIATIHLSEDNGRTILNGVPILWAFSGKGFELMLSKVPTKAGRNVIYTLIIIYTVFYFGYILNEGVFITKFYLN